MIRLPRLLLAALLVLMSVLGVAAPALAHTYSAVVYLGLTEPEPGVVRAELEMEYALLAMDGGAEMGDATFEPDAYAEVMATGQDPSRLTVRALDEHSDTVEGYILPRLTVSVEPEHGEEPGDVAGCEPAIAEPYAITLIENVPHARFVIDYDCRASGAADFSAYRVTSELFPSTGPGGKTTTVVEYDLRSGSGVANLDTDTSPTMTTAQDWGSRMGEFFVLGAEHLLFGLDHILFLLALIVGSRRLRDIVLAATAFTVAHSVTFILAALGIVRLPGIVVEPVIALSIAAVAAWYLWGVWRRRAQRADEFATRGGFTRADMTRVLVVFAFGLIHGIGFAGALGIAEPFSWGLLGALLVFNVGIEVVQLAIILVVFPLLALLRRHRPVIALRIGVAVSAVVAIVGLYWVVTRLLGIESII